MDEYNNGRPPYPFENDPAGQAAPSPFPSEPQGQAADSYAPAHPYTAGVSGQTTPSYQAQQAETEAEARQWSYVEEPAGQTAQAPFIDPNPVGYAASQVATPEPLKVSVDKGSSRFSGVKSTLLGLAGGSVGALAVTLALNAVGFGGSAPKAPEVAQSSAGQTISINASTEDATVAKAVAAKALPSVVSVYVTSSAGEGLGSGAVLDTEGNIITNYHVVEGAEHVSVTIGGKSYDATVVGTDASSDLAVVKAELNGDTVTPIEVGDSDALVVGDWVMTIGSPFGLDQSVSAGIVSSLSRNQLMVSATGNTLYTNLIQTDAAINPGNSGGALVNAQGQLVGIDTLFSSDTESFAGIGFAIPGNYAVEVANKIIAGEPVTHAYVGLSMQTVNAQNAQANHLSVNQGAYVAQVSENSPAEAAGIKEGDVITSLDGEAITSADGMILAVRSHKIGETVEIGFVRGSEEMTAQITFGDDAELQKQQKEELERQQQEQDNGFGNGYGIRDDRGDGYGRDISYEDILEYLFSR